MARGEAPSKGPPMTLRNGRAGDAVGTLGDAGAAPGDAPRAPGRASSGAGTASPGPNSVPKRPHPPEGSRALTPNGDAGDSGDAVSLLSNEEERRGEKEGGRANIEDKGKTASPPSPASPPSEDEDDEKPKLSDQIVEIVESQADLFRDAKGDSYATITDAHGVERTVRLDTGAFRAWIAYVVRAANGRSVSPATIDEARLALQGLALYEREEKPVHVRVAEHEGALYLDLGDDTGACIRCTPRSWTEIDRPPVKFLRPSGLRPLPRPVRGGSVEDLRPLVNLHDDDFWLLVAWLVAAFRPGRPFTILALQGEQGTAKSTAARVARRLIDPNVADVRSPPRNEDDLMVMAHNGHVSCVDNLSGIAPWLSDALCRISTGGGLSKRRHYENADEVIVEALRPQVLNGIDDIAARADLAERSIVLTLEPITKRRDEASFWADFNAAAPGILGALLDAVCRALADVDTVKLDELPRMADFVKWVTAAEPALGLRRGTILRAYRANLSNAAAIALEASVVAVAVRALVEKHKDWSGSADELLCALVSFSTSEKVLSRAWPKDGARLSGRLRRDAVPLRAAGIAIEFGSGGRGQNKKRRITLRKDSR